MNIQFLSIADAVNFINNSKSYSTLLRLAKKLKDTKNVKIENGKYYISEQYLIDNFEVHEYSNDKQRQANDKHEYSNESQIIELLRNELNEKNKQISELHILLDRAQKALPHTKKENLNAWQKFLHKLGLIQPDS